MRDRIWSRRASPLRALSADGDFARPHESAALVLGGAAPDAELLPRLEGEVEALGLHRTGGADRQGLGAAGVMSVNTALVRFLYPGRLQGLGFGRNAMVVATAFTFGPTIASGILVVGPWTWLFAINIPFGIVAIFIGLKTLPHTPRAARVP